MNELDAKHAGRLALWLLIFGAWLKAYETATSYLHLYRLTILLAGFLIMLDVIYQVIFGFIEPDEDDAQARAENIIDIVLFDDDENKIETLYRKRGSPIPRVGEDIVLDCGHAVTVVTVSYQRDEPNLVQILTKEITPQ